MNIANILKLKFPELDLTKDVIIQDDGKGPYIAKWDESLGQKPDAATLALWETEVTPLLEEQTARENRRNNYPPIGDQLDAILKHYDFLESQGKELGPELRAVKEQWKKVKEDYPL